MLLKPEFDPPVKSVDDFMARNMTLRKSNSLDVEVSQKHLNEIVHCEQPFQCCILTPTGGKLKWKNQKTPNIESLVVI